LCIFEQYLALFTLFLFTAEFAVTAEIGFVLPMNTDSILVSDFVLRISDFRPQAGDLGLFFQIVLLTRIPNT